MNLRDLTRLEAQLDDSLREFGLLGMLGVGAAIHAGQNLMTKGLLKSKRGQRVLASIAQAGHRDAKQGKVVHPMLQRSSDMLLGPEYSHLYNSGGQTSRVQRLVAAARTRLPGNDEAKQVANIIAGPRSKKMDWLMKKLPRVSKAEAATPKHKWLGRAAAAVTGAGTAMVEPVMPLINGARSLIAKHPLGDKLIRRAGMAGLHGKPAGGISRALTDLVGSPMLSQTQNAAYHALKPFRGGAQKFSAKHGKRQDADGGHDEWQHGEPGDFLTLLHRLDSKVEFALLRGGVLVSRPPLKGGAAGWNRHGGGKDRPVRMFRPLHDADMPKTPAAIAARQFNPKTDVHLDYLRQGKRMREVDVMSAPHGASQIRSGRAIHRVAKSFLEHADKRRLVVKTTANAYGHESIPSGDLAKHYERWGFKSRKAKAIERMRLKEGATQKQAEDAHKDAVPMVRFPRPSR